MKFHPLFSFFCILCHTFIVKVRSQENFTAVTSFSELKELYVKLQDKGNKTISYSGFRKQNVSQYGMELQSRTANH